MKHRGLGGLVSARALGGLVSARALGGLVLVLTAAAAASGQGRPVVFAGATLHPVSGPPIEDGVLVAVGGRITAVGTVSEVRAPTDSHLRDAGGLHLFPALVHAGTSLGLVEVPSVAATVDASELGTRNAGLRAEAAFNTGSELLPAAVVGGVGFAHAVPRGGLFSGLSALVRLDGRNLPEALVAAPVGLHLRFPEAGPERETLDRQADEARAYAATGGRNDPHLEALAAALGGTLPLFLHAETLAHAEAGLDWAEAQGLERLVLVAGAEAVPLAGRLAEKGVPVILTGVLRLPPERTSAYDEAYTAAARLDRSGVLFAIADSGSPGEAAGARDLPYHAAMAAAFGLPRERALEAVTLAPAEILGVSDRLGSLEPGKEASFVLTDGPPLEVRSRVVEVWLAGRRVGPRGRPPQAPPGALGAPEASP